jgi:hypothetical protein
MQASSRRLGFIMALLLFWATGGEARAGRVRFHYAPVDDRGNTTLKPAEYGGPGERVSWFGFVSEPYFDQPRPTHMATYRHSYTGRLVAVPVTLPESTPRIEHRGRHRLIYNYGSDTVEIHFLPDGSVDVIYDSGLFRRP